MEEITPVAVLILKMFTIRLTLIIVFLYYAITYLWDRYYYYDEDDEEIYLEEWRKYFSHHKRGECKNLIIPAPRALSCHQILEAIGCKGKVLTHRFTVPKGYHIFTSLGGKLKENMDYCIWQVPSSSCHPGWGFLKYNEKSNLWECYSKVPGIYNAATNSFDACQPGGRLFDSKERRVVVDYTQLSPEDFYSDPTRYVCRCDKGYLSFPEISRSTCFPDPCLSHLPPLVDPKIVPGYDKKTGKCDCGALYVNIHGNPHSPCTACPDHPTLDEGKLIVWISCKNGYYPCHKLEDIQRGCTRAEFSVEIKKNTDDFRRRIVGLN